MKTIRISSMGFMQGRLQICSSSGSCLRNLLLKSEGLDSPIPIKYTKLGALNEDRYATTVADTSGVSREYSVEIALRDGVVARGRIDFLREDPESGHRVVYELKSADSKRTRLECIRKGNPKVDNLAQLVTYMLAAKTTEGYLQYNFYEDSETDNPKCTEERRYRVDISDTGAILIDTVPSDFTVHDLLTRLNAAADVLTQGIIWDRPKDWELKWKSPCTFCNWAKVCDEYDDGYLDSVVEFIAYAKKILEQRNEENERSATPSV